MKKRNVYRLADGTRVPGVTSISSILSKPALIFWSANKAVEHVEENWKPDKSYSKEDIKIVLSDAKCAHLRAKEDAGDFGSGIHEIVEAYIGGQLKPESLDGNERKALANFIFATKGWEWLGSEIVVINEKYRYGGTADGLAKLPDGKIVITDIKTGHGVYPEADLQVAMYAYAKPQNKSLAGAWSKIEEARILHFNKKRITWEVLERDISCQYDFIPHFRECYEWRKLFE